ncbi:MAG TPA: hypothetical protein VFM18_19600, partial [Methanosarcina sp.]|nr:hypothetical protein [Methanosarcina sp.]
SFFAITEYSWDGNKKEMSGIDRLNEILSGNAGKGNSRIKDPMGAARILMAISLPLFMVLVGYCILKKKI